MMRTYRVVAPGQSVDTAIRAAELLHTGQSAAEIAAMRPSRCGLLEIESQQPARHGVLRVRIRVGETFVDGRFADQIADDVRHQEEEAFRKHPERRLAAIEGV